MFSMCSELTPRAPIPDSRIAQFMQPCLTDEEVLEYFVHVVGSMNMRYEGIRKKLIQVGGKLLKYFEEDNLHVLAGTDICFSVPIVDDLEVKICIIFSSNSLFSASPDDLEVKK